jgi:hypothetical protein
VIGAEGGTLALGGTSVTIRAGVLSSPTTLTLSLPATGFMEVEIEADGQEHFVFAAAVSLEIDYSRCPAADLRSRPLRVWHVEDERASKVKFRNLGGTDDRANRKMSVATDHLSTYVIAH